jgi:hypothetical protein
MLRAFGRDTEAAMGEFGVLVFLGSGGVLILAGLFSAYQAAQSPPTSVGLGVAAAAFAVSGALCYWAAAWLIGRPGGLAPDANLGRMAGPGAAPDRVGGG